MKNSKSLAPTVLRVGISAVFIWFGVSQLLNQGAWVSFIPPWLVSVSGISTVKLVIINGFFETVAGALLALGILVRPVAILLFLHLVGIVFEVGLSAIGVRDIGLAVATLSIALYGNDLSSPPLSPSPQNQTF